MANNSTDAICSAVTIDVSYLIPNVILICIYCCLGVVANSLVLYTYKKEMNDTKDDRYFIPYLAFTDTVSCLTTSASALLELFYHSHGSDVCDLLIFTEMLPVSVSGALVVYIAFQRYYKICKPHINCKISNRGVVPLLVLCGFISSGSSILFSRLTRSHNKAPSLCSIYDKMCIPDLMKIYNVCVASLCFLFLLMVSAFYICIGVKIQKQFKIAYVVSKNNGKIPRCQELLDLFPETTINTPVDFLSFTPIKDESSIPVATDPQIGNDHEPCFYSLDRLSRKSLTTRPHTNLIENKKRNENTHESPRKTQICGSEGDLSKISVSNRPSCIFSSYNKTKKSKVVNEKFLKRKRMRYYRFISLVLSMTTLYFCLISPKIVLTIMDYINPHFMNSSSRPGFVAMLILSRLYILVFFVNSIIYGFSDGKFMKSFKRSVCQK